AIERFVRQPRSGSNQRARQAGLGRIEHDPNDRLPHAPGGTVDDDVDEIAHWKMVAGTRDEGRGTSRARFRLWIRLGRALVKGGASTALTRPSPLVPLLSGSY